VRCQEEALATFTVELMAVHVMAIADGTVENVLMITSYI
jgi:hypothetical protein